MNIETNWVRVISNTKDPENKEMNKMIGGEFEVRSSCYYGDDVFLLDEDKSDIWCFNKSDVRFLTPIKFKDRHIAIGDKIKLDGEWYEVISFAEAREEKCLFIEDVYKEVCFAEENEIQDHDPGIETDDKTEEDIGKHYKQGRQDEWERCVNLLDFDHSECPEPTSCIGYQSAQSDLMNNPPNIKEEEKGGGGGKEAEEFLRQMGENESEEVKKAVETLTRQGYKVTLE
jgi:hypothetical protein